MEEHDVELHELWEPATPSVGRSAAQRAFGHETAALLFHPLSLLVIVALAYGCIQLARQPEAAVPNEAPVWRSVSARGEELRDAPAALKADSLSTFRSANLKEYGGPKKLAKGAEFAAAVAAALKSPQKDAK